MRKLADVAQVLRSKNAGPFCVTIDVMFEDDAAYQLVADSHVLSAVRMADLYRIPVERVNVLHHPLTRAIKINLYLPVSAGSMNCMDVYGCQYHVPLLDLPIFSEGGNS